MQVQKTIENSNNRSKTIWKVINNKLHLNETKTSIIQFRSNFRPETFSHSRLKYLFTLNTKFLGMYIDEHLKWQVHLQEIKPKLSKAIFGIRKFFLKKINKLCDL